jgi:hypothetical protein
MPIQVRTQPAEQMSFAAARFAKQQQRFTLPLSGHPIYQLQAFFGGGLIDARYIGFRIIQRTAYDVARKRIGQQPNR